MSTDVMIVEEAECEEAEEERSVAVDSTSTAVGSADSEDENNSGEENSVQCECCEARQTCGQAGKICNGLHPLFFSSACGRSFVCFVFDPASTHSSKIKRTKLLPQVDERRCRHV